MTGGRIESYLDAPLSGWDGVAEFGDEAVRRDQQGDASHRGRRHGESLAHGEDKPEYPADHRAGGPVDDLGDERPAAADQQVAGRQVGHQQAVLRGEARADRQHAVQTNPGLSRVDHG